MTRVPIGLALAVALAVTLTAQRGQPPAGQPQTVFRSATQYVALDVIVRDKNDRPVTDLTKDDFVVTERDHPQTVRDFAYISIPVGDRPVDLDAPPKAFSDIATNGQTSQNSRALVLTIDDTALGVQDLIPVKRVVAELIRKLSPDDQVALTYIGRSDLSHDFTNDFGALMASVKLRDALGLPSLGPSNAIRSLEFIVNTLAASRHTRRAVILITSHACRPLPNEGLPSMENDQCRDLIKRAKQADVVFYTIDPRLFTDLNSTQGIGNIDTPERASELAAESIADDNSMKTLASGTGGRTFTRASDPLRAVEDVMVDNGSYYLLGFYPDPIVNDGKFHDIQVTVKRPGLRVRSRAGYMAGDDKPPKLTTATRDMTGRLGTGIDDPSLSIRAFVAPIADAPNGTTALVTIEVSYPVAETGSMALDDELRVGILSLTPDAKIKRSFQRAIRFTGRWKPTARSKFLINEVIELPHQALSLRIGVTSRALAKTGTTHIFVSVPDFGDKDLQLSSLVLGTNDSSFDAAAGLDFIRPFVPFQPTTIRSFTRDHTLRVFANSFWKSDDEAVTADISVKGGSPFATQSVTLPGRIDKNGHREGTLDRTLSLKDLAPGSYVLRVDVHSLKRKPAFREIPFEIR